MASRKQRAARLSARRAHRALAPYPALLWREEGRQAPQGPRMRLLPSHADRLTRRKARKARNAQARAHAEAVAEAEASGETQVQAWRRQAHEGRDQVERAWRRTFKGIHVIGYRRNAHGLLEPGKSGLQMVGKRPASSRVEPQSVMNPDQRLNPTRRRRHRHVVHAQAGGQGHRSYGS